MITLVHPGTPRGISDDFAAHVKRHSVNPGTDYLFTVGTRVNAVKAGRVTVAHQTYAGSGGRYVEIDHGDGDVTQYLHLDVVDVAVGQQVSQGQQIASSGSSANGKSRGGVGPHLHLSLKRHGRNIDFAALILQQTLNTKTGTTLVEDGVNGKATDAATRAFQAAHGLVVDGKARQATWGVLDALPIPAPPAPPGPGPMQRQVLAAASVNRRTEPSGLGEKIGSAAAKSIVTLTGWRHGQTVSGVDVWFTDGSGWMWAGGFTDQGTHDLPDLTPIPEPEPEPEPQPTPAPEPTPDPVPPVDVPPVPETPTQPVSVWGLIVGGIIVGVIALVSFLTGGLR